MFGALTTNFGGFFIGELKMNWYILDKYGYAERCDSEAYARRMAKERDRLFPGDGPHRAVQLVEYAEPELTRLSVACDVQTLCANGDLPDSMEVLADWIAAGEMRAQPAHVQEPVLQDIGMMGPRSPFFLRQAS
jgi:hypothetical protein